MSEKQTFNLSSILPPEQIFILPGHLSKTDIINQLSQAVCQGEEGLDCMDVFTQILKREENLSTTLDTGLSIPHARLEDLTHFKAAMAILQQPVQDLSKPEAQIKVMFLFLSPGTQAFFQQHLQILAALAEKFNTNFIEELLACKTPAEAARKIAKN